MDTLQKIDEKILKELEDLKLENKTLKAQYARNLTKRKRADLERQVMYEIIQGVTTTSNLGDLLKLIHQSLKEVIYAENCFVALYDQNTELFSFPYFVDKFDPIPEPVALRNSCTAYVFQTGKPLMLTQELFDKLIEQKKVELVGSPSPSWIGVPLKTPTRTIGVLVLQHYEEENIYSEHDVKFLDAIGTQTAVVIELKRAEEDLRNERLLLRTVIDNIPDSIYCKDIDCRKTLANVTELRYSGAKSEKEILGKTDFDLYPKELAEGFFADDQLVIQSGQSILNREEYLLDKKGEKQWLLTSKLPLKDEKGIIVGIVGIGRNITTRKRAEEALRESEVKLNVILQSTADGILAVDGNGKVIKTNERFAQLWHIPQFLIDSGNDDALLASVLEQLVDPEEFISKVKKLYSLTDEDLDTLHFKDGRIFERYSAPLIMNDSSIGRVWSFRDISERKRAEEEIKKRNEELSKTNAEKDKFFSIIAHDLKSPFQGLVGLSEIMATEDENLSRDELIVHSKSLNESASNIFKLIEDLLEWSQMQKGSINFKPKEFNIASCVAQNLEVLKQRAIQKGITLINEVPSTEKVYADEKMVDTILRNLLSNAVKFTRRDGEVLVTAKKIEGEMVEVSVSDTGIGMSENNVKKLFKIEEKVSSKGTEGEESTGLGLLLCKEFVEKHGSEIWVESEKGKGSTFYFTLPEKEILLTGETIS